MTPRQLKGAAAGDHLALVERGHGNLVDRHPDLARVSGAVGGVVGLRVRRWRCEHDAVDQHPGHDDAAGVERPVGRDALHLGDDEPVGIPGSHRSRLGVEHQGLPLHRDVARRVGRGAPDQRHIDGKDLVEEPLLAIELHDPHQLLRGARVDLAAAQPRIDECAEADLAERAGAVGRRVAIEVGDRAERQVVPRDAVVDRHLGELGNQRPVAADSALDQPVSGEAVEAALLAVPGCGREDERQVARRFGVDEALLERSDQHFGRADPHEARAAHCVAVADQRDRLVGGDDLVFAHTALTAGCLDGRPRGVA